MILSDSTLREAVRTGRIGFGPGDPLSEQFQPASIDFCLGRHFRAFKNAGLAQQKWQLFLADPVGHVYREIVRPPLDVSSFDPEEEMEAFEADHLILQPFQFCLGTTMERVRLPADLRGVLYGRSSLARLGLVVHTVAGNLDPGFAGEITLELLNVGSRALKIPAGWRVAHVSFEQLDQAAAQPYGLKKNSKYQDQRGATASMVQKDTTEGPERHFMRLPCGCPDDTHPHCHLRNT